MLESRFKSKLCKELYTLFPGCMIIHGDANETQGIPDLIILYEDKWAALEGKRDQDSPHQPNQDYYVDLMNSMSFASFVYPENKREVLDELQQTFLPRRKTRISQCK